jgi:uncharacterized protein
MVKGIGENAANGIQVTSTLLTAEEDRVAMEAKSYGEMNSGKVYQNIYHIMHIVKDGKILTVREHMDTEHATATFSS